MSIPPAATPQAPQTAPDVRRRAIRRLAIALLLLGAAFLALLGYEQMGSPRTVAPVAPTLPPPSPPARVDAVPATPEAGPAASGDTPAAEPTPNAPAGTEPARVPPPPVVINSEPPAPAPPPRPPARGTVPPTPTAAPAPAAASARAQGAPATNAPAPAAAAGRPEPKSDGSRGYLLQAGVFGSPQNAQALERKLAEAGFAASTETRVVLGPFRSRAEADRALDALRRLGVEAVVLPGR